MTVEAMSSLPFQAGSAVAAAAGRTALWAVSIYMRQPLRNTALAALVGLSAMAGSNALYKQSHHHPAPLFGTFDEAAPVVKKARPAAVLPAAKPKKLAQPVSEETTGSVDAAATVDTINTDDVLAMQQKLIALGMLDGKADGMFGPRTAKAIKAFESSVGRTPRGLLTPTIVAMIRDAQMPAPIVPVPAKTELPALVVPKVNVPTATVTAQLAPAPVTIPTNVTTDPLPAPSPLLASTAAKPAASQAAPVQVAALEAPAPADAASVVVTPPETATPDPATAVTKRPVQTIAVHAAPAAADSESEDQPSADDLAPITEGEDASSDHDVVAAVQRGLNSLGFLHQQVDGVAGEATAKAIRNFEVYYRYDVTGRVTRELVRLLKQNGAAT
jgi:peptidoglycan hydrolase-like protein with peptidoglycan-binding domain